MFCMELPIYLSKSLGKFCCSCLQLSNTLAAEHLPQLSVVLKPSNYVINVRVCVRIRCQQHLASFFAPNLCIKYESEEVKLLHMLFSLSFGDCLTFGTFLHEQRK